MITKEIEMVPEEIEQPMGLVVFEISLKTSKKDLEEFSNQGWRSTATRQVAEDIVDNGKELLARSDIDWKSVLENIRSIDGGSERNGVAAIAMHRARTIGALALYAGWSMHEPAIVYLSAKCLEKIASSNKHEDFRMKMRNAAYVYGWNNLPNADLYIKTLDLLLEIDRDKHRADVRQAMSLLGEGDIKEAYNKIIALGAIVRS